MSPRAIREPSLMEVALRQAGFRKGWKGCLYLAQWGIASDDKGRPLNARGVSQWWGESTATSYRNEGAFKLAFPDETSPERLWGLVKVPRASREDLATVVSVVVSARWAVAA